MNRRKVLTTGFSALAGITTAGVTGAGAQFLVGDSLETTGAQWVQVSSVDALAPDQMHRVNYSVRVRDAWQNVEQAGTLFVYIDSESSTDDTTDDLGKYSVLDATCTHLGCLVRWKEGEQQFACSCHAGFFDRNGEVIEGPPPTALHKLPTKIEDGVLWAEV